MVFDAAWEQMIRERYGGRPAYQRPPIYYFAVGESWKEVRDEIEQWVSQLPSRSHGKLIKTLHGAQTNLQRIIHIHHELAVAYALMGLGYHLEYEQEVNGVTPDWYVCSRGQVPAFVVEVFTDNASENDDTSIRQLGELFARLKLIPVDATLEVICDSVWPKSTPKRTKEIARDVCLWLAEGHPSAGAELKLEGVSFRVCLLGAGTGGVKCLGPVSVFAVSNQPLRAKLERKIDKYKELNIPLIIAVVPSPRTGRGLDNVLDVLLGNEQWSFSIEDSSSAEVSRAGDGLLRVATTLSAVLWLTKGLGWEVHVITNPSANNSLPPQTWHLS